MASAWSDPWNFTVEPDEPPPPEPPEAPEAPTPLAPQGTSRTSPPTFEWSPLPTATSYELYVRGRGNQVVILETTVDTSFEPSAPLDVKTSHRWRVRAQNEAGYGPHSDWLTFSFDEPDDPTSPTAPSPIAPKGKLKSNPPTFEWSAVAEATTYELSLWDKNLASEIFLAVVAGTTYTPPGPIDPTHSFQWRVRAGSGTDFGPYSKWTKFRP